MERPCAFYSEDFLKHDSRGHPECKERLERTMSYLLNRPLAGRLEFRSPGTGKVTDIEAVHAPLYVTMALGLNDGMLDPDTYMCAGSAGAALKAAGAAVECVNGAMAGRKLSIGLVRPPGHHALPAKGMGFCIFNNAAIGAAHALKSRKKVLIVDWDVHHGNGTESMFYYSPDVLYFSVHQYPFYPGTGKAEDMGEGEGEGFNVNVPLPAGCTDADYIEAFRRILLPVMDEFTPDLIIVSAGYDTHYDDPLGGMQMTEAGFHRLAGMVADAAKGANIVVLLEGGYSLAHLPSSIEASLLGFMGEPYEGEMTKEKTKAASARIDEAHNIHRQYWRL